MVYALSECCAAKTIIVLLEVNRYSEDVCFYIFRVVSFPRHLSGFFLDLDYQGAMSASTDASYRYNTVLGL